MKKRITALFLAFIMGIMTLADALVLAETPAEEPAAEETAAESLKISMVTDVGGVKDQSLTKVLGKALKQKQILVLKLDILMKQDADYEPNLETLVDGENDLIWALDLR